MEDPGTVFFTGTAGAGKTSLVQAFKEWMSHSGYDATVVNLDPGNENPTLEPDVDVREWVRLPDVMTEYDLGPNGAQVVASDLIAIKVFEIKQALAEFRSDLVLVDTPGQVELFAFRESSKSIVEALGGDQATIAFLFDPALARSPAGFVSLLLLSASVEFRFRAPMVNLLTKSDLIPPEQLEEVLAWAEEPGRLSAAVDAVTPTPDMQLSTQVYRAIELMAPMTGLLATSAKDSTGLESVYRAVQRNLGGGEDLEPAQAPPE